MHETVDRALFLRTAGLVARQWGKGQVYQLVDEREFHVLQRVVEGLPVLGSMQNPDRGSLLARIPAILPRVSGLSLSG